MRRLPRERRPGKGKRIGLVCQHFPPEVAPIGVMMAELARDLSAAGHEVRVITGYPNHPHGRVFDGFVRRLGGEEQPTSGGYILRRVWLYVSSSRGFFPRVLNYLSFSVLATLACLRRRHDVCLVVSPPLSNVFIGVALRLFGSRYVLCVQDIYPDAAIAVGIIRNGLVVRAARVVERVGYRLAQKVIVISEGFAVNLRKKGVRPGKISVIPNWIDLDEIRPSRRLNSFSVTHGLAGRFTVLYSGTIGLVSGAEIVLELAGLLVANSRIVLMMVGEGAVKRRIETEARDSGLRNLRFAPFQPREALSDVLGCASVGLVTLKPGHGGNSVPSKILGYMAAGKPVIASVDPGSDTWRFVADAQCGICVPPGDPTALVDAVIRLEADPDLVSRLGVNGRRYLEQNLSRAAITARYEETLRRCI